MDISVAVVTYNAERYIGACLDSILKQKPHGGVSEILVVDGCSMDGTKEIVGRFGDRVRLIENPKRTIAANRNVALRQANYPYIAFTDSDCVVPDNWLSTLSKAFEMIQRDDNNSAGVGGGNIAPAYKGAFNRALGISLDSFFGSLGSVQGKIFDQQRPVDSLACLNVLYKKEELESTGGFDERLSNMCEDADINYRLKQRGRTLYFIPGANVEHRARRSMLSWLANMYAYGVGRAKIMRKHRTLFSPVYVIPLCFLPVLIIGSLFGMIWPWGLLVWLYIPMTFCIGFVLAIRKRTFLGLQVGLILLGTHFCYAAGLLRGLSYGYAKTP